MSFAYSPVNKNQYKIITQQVDSSSPPPIRRITGGSATTSDIFLIPFISEEKYKYGYQNPLKVEWTFDFGEINEDDIFILDSQWDPKTMAFFATCLWDSPNYTGAPLIDNGWTKASFSTSVGDFYTHEHSIELGFFHNQNFSPKTSQFYCADFSKINLSDFKKTKSTGAYEMSRKDFLAKYATLLCKTPLDNCCSALPEPKSYPIKLPPTFKKIYADKITNFNPSTDTLEIDTDSFGTDNSTTFAAGKNKKAVKKELAKQDFDFIYDQKKGGLYFNENGSDKGFGDGGIIAILKGAPELNASNLEFI